MTSNQMTKYPNQETAKPQPSTHLLPWLKPNQTHESKETRSKTARKIQLSEIKKMNPVLNQAYTNSSEHQNVQTIGKETHTDEENSRAPKHIEDGS